MQDDPKQEEQAPDENKAPGQQTPTRGYGRQVHEESKSSADKEEEE